MISIIVPVYNGEKYVKKCADALISQSYKNIEIIFINDGSNDNTAALLDDIRAIDNRVKVIHKENGGVSSARNRGIAEATGEYIMFCDSDDIPHYNFCEELLKCMEQFPNTLPICANIMIDNLSNSAVCTFGLPQEVLTAECTRFTKDDIPMIEKWGILYALWNKIFVADIINQNVIRFDETTSNGEDTLFVFEYLSYMEGNTVYLNNPLYSYVRQNSECLSLQKPYEEMITVEKNFHAANKFFSKLKFNKKEAEEAFYDFYLNRFINAIDGIIKFPDYKKSVRFKKGIYVSQLSGFKSCIKNVNSQNTYHRKLIKIYKSKFLTVIYFFKKIYLRKT